MTLTQAQIEAAAKVLNVSYENKAYAIQMAKAALTAAAEVGEQDWRDAKIKTLENTARINLSAYKTVKAELDATIERCAHVAEAVEAWDTECVKLKAAIVAAIRALKEKP